MAVGFAILTAATAAGAAEPTPPDPDGTAFFEKKVRPVLVDHCYKCHSVASRKKKGDFWIDSRASLRKGGETGPALVPGDADKSLLIQAVRYRNKDLQMPPDDRLPASVVADLEAWVKMGAPDPRAAEGASAPRPAVKHWAFTPPRDQPLPEVRDRTSTWPLTPIDRFILAKLEARQMAPAPPADRRTLIRRATYDLIGLPPTPAETEAFVRDRSPDAYGRLVERLLASPRYGERWGRYWLDVARYADSTGPRLGRFAFAYTYRDWVIRAFNDDLPYDQFLIQQLAADRLLRTGADRQNLAALGFLTVGRKNNRDTVDDVIDDWIDVVARGTLGLTVGCARCHDHKFDPISTADYYALHGIFLNTRRVELPPLLGEAATSVRDRGYEEALRGWDAAIARVKEQKYEKILAGLRAPSQIAAYLVAGEEARRLKPGAIEALSKERDLEPGILLRWRDLLDDNDASGRQDPFWAPWYRLGALSRSDFETQAPALAGRMAHEIAAADATAPHGDRRKEALRQLLRGPEAPFLAVPPDDFEGVMAEATPFALSIAELWARYADAGGPPRAMAVEDAPELRPSYVHVRGDRNNRGEDVPRRFLSVLSAGQPRAFTDGSGRAELARAIASADNPLTARVMVNRVWQHHFGAGIVGTPSDFGTRGDPPSHPELLDHLARRFVADGWSVKSLHRSIMLSRVYQQAGVENAAYRRADPGNRLLWRANRRRLDFEALRDTILAVSGGLDLTMGGPPGPLFSQPTLRRRTVYGLIDRAQVPGTLRAFDFANPDQHTPARHLNTVPQQALFLMNSPFMAEQARLLAGRREVAAARSPAARIQALYRIALGRPAANEELDLALGFLEAKRSEGAGEPPQGPSRASSAGWQYGSGLYDEGRQRVTSFQPFPVFVGADQQIPSLVLSFPLFTEIWQAGPRLPDPAAGFAFLSATGGEPGDGSAHAVVRRWVAPASGSIRIAGTLQHKVAKEHSDGISARIVSSRHGQVASWTLVNMETETKLGRVEVKAGDAIDFVVDGRATPFGDEFTWAPTVVLARDDAGPETTFDAVKDFRGPTARSLSPLEQLALVLLQTNELVFVD